jgi:hypothetical protein
MRTAPLGHACDIHPPRTLVRAKRETLSRFCAFPHARAAHALTGAAPLAIQAGVQPVTSVGERPIWLSGKCLIRIKKCGEHHAAHLMR